MLDGASDLVGGEDDVGVVLGLSVTKQNGHSGSWAASAGQELMQFPLHP